MQKIDNYHNSEEWFSELVFAFDEKNTSLFIDLLNFAINTPAHFFQYENLEILDNLSQEHFDKRQEIERFFRALNEWLKTENRKVAFPCFSTLIEALGALSKKLEEWFLPVLKFLISKTKHFAIQTNKAQKTGKITEDNLNKAADSIRGVLSNFQSMKSDSSKMKVILFLINELFWINFKLINYHQCKSLLQTQESKLGGELSDYPKSEQVTFYYYSGRMCLFDSKLKEAYQHLHRAYLLCQGYQGSNSIRIKRQILKYLIPIKIYYGEFPHEKLMETYQLYEYIELSLSIYKGDISSFKRHLEEFKKLWIQRGLYFFMEKLNIILLRNLFKLTFNILSENGKNVQMDTEMFAKAINWKSQEKYDIDEVECILAQLIFKSYIKGYISHEKRKIVFGKNGAFPPISEVAKK